ncbi:unnamed protein product [Hermetia illucens]|uniref:Uncharacterized protein n=1 Tax=Hermetia illucens TaxID=343691 RepID=A0A7R8YQY4_HERIL|nr:unnamed protein product [Hermetia illucens]
MEILRLQLVKFVLSFDNGIWESNSINLLMSHYSLTLNQEKTPSDSRLQQNTFKITGFDGIHVAVFRFSLIRCIITTKIFWDREKDNQIALAILCDASSIC